MKAVTLKCRPNSCFHFGKFAPDSDTALNNSDEMFHSDSLFSAIVVTYNNIFDDTNDFVEQFEKDSIKISSLFYKIEASKNSIWFLPKPVNFNLIEVDDYKSFKKISFISKKLYTSLINADELSGNQDIILLQNKYALFASELDVNANLIQDIRLYNSIIQPKVLVNTDNQEDTLYQLNVIEIADNSSIDNKLLVHFYFLFDTSPDFDEKFGERFSVVLDILACSSIGAEKGTIGGLEGYTIDENWDVNVENVDDNYAMLISLCNPQMHEFDKLKNCFCNSVLRGGRTIDKKKNKNEQERLKSIRMLTEGSIVNKNIKGRIVDIKPDNWDRIPFKRNGVALMLPIKKTWIK